MDQVKIRKASADDAPAVCRIYNYYIENTPVSFETDPLSPEQMRARIAEITEAGFPYYVAET